MTSSKTPRRLATPPTMMVPRSTNVPGYCQALGVDEVAPGPNPFSLRIRSRGLSPRPWTQQSVGSISVPHRSPAPLPLYAFILHTSLPHASLAPPTLALLPHASLAPPTLALLPHASLAPPTLALLPHASQSASFPRSPLSALIVICCLTRLALEGFKRPLLHLMRQLRCVQAQLT
jgi:hypothetical protein